nr:SDR family oxidoreductase [Streptomyces humi]
MLHAGLPYHPAAARGSRLAASGRGHPADAGSRSSHRSAASRPWDHPRGCGEPITTSCGADRFGRPEEIAAAVVCLASPHADCISGATLRVDGGTIRSVN